MIALHKSSCGRNNSNSSCLVLCSKHHIRTAHRLLLDWRQHWISCILVFVVLLRIALHSNKPTAWTKKNLTKKNEACGVSIFGIVHTHKGCCCILNTPTHHIDKGISTSDFQKPPVIFYATSNCKRCRSGLWLCVDNFLWQTIRRCQSFQSSRIHSQGLHLQPRCPRSGHGRLAQEQK